MLARTVCRSRAYSHVAAGVFLPGGLPAIAASTDNTLHLLVAAEGSQDGEGCLEVVCDLPLFATARALAALPAASPDEEDCLALLTDSGFLSILRFDAACARFVALQQVPLPPEAPGDPFCQLAVHQRGGVVAAASLGGAVCLAVRDEAAAAPGSAAGGPRFSRPAQLTLGPNLWSLVFLEGGPAGGGASLPGDPWLAAGSCHTALLAALHQQPGDGSFAVVEYRCSIAAGLGAGHASVVGSQLLPAARSPAFSPRALVQLPAGWQEAAGCRLLVREEAVEVLAASGGVQEQPSAGEWWARRAPPPPAAGSQEAAAEPPGVQPMVLSHHPSWEGLEEGSEGGGDEHMPAAEPSSAAAGYEFEQSIMQTAAEGDSSSSGDEATSGGASGQFINCWCWEWQPRGQPPAPVLVCALEDGSMWRVPLIAQRSEHAPGVGAMLTPGRNYLQRLMSAQPARSIAALPGRLLVYCTDASGLQLLRERGLSHTPLLPAHMRATHQPWLDWDWVSDWSSLPAAAAVADCQLADLEGGSQRQLYAVRRATGGGASAGGGLCVLYPDPKPETVFELPGAAEGITGLWGLRRRAADRHHSLALLSYVGGSRLLAAQGGIFRDVTDCCSLQADAQTLAAGNMAAAGAGPVSGPAAVAQVTSQMVLTFSAAAAPPASGGGLSLQSSAGGAGGSGCTWQPPAGSSIGAAAVAEQAVLLYCTGGAARHLIALLPAASAAEAPQGGCEHGQPAGHVTLTQAAALPMAAEVSCVSNLLLAPAQRAQHGQQAQQHSAVFAVGTYSSAVLLVQLQWGPQQQGSLQLLLTVDLTSTSAATGLASAAATAAAAAGPLSPRSFQREQLTPESLLLLPAEASASSSGELHGSQARSGGSGGGGAMVPGAASLVAGLRTGALLQLHCAWSCGQQQQPQEELLSVSLGHMPVVILPLPRHQPLAAAAAAGAVPPAAAVLSDRVSLLRYRPAAAAGHGGAWGGAGRVSCQQLALPQVQAAAALLLDSGGLGGSGLTLDAMAAAGEAEEQQEAAAGGAPGPSGEQQQQQQQQLFLLCAAADGCLRMVSLESQLLAATRCWPLRQLLQPSRLAVHEGSGSVVVAGACTLPHHTRRGDEHVVVAGLAAVQAVDPATGELLASYSGFMPGESITALAVWDPSAPKQPAQQAQQQQQQQEHAVGAVPPGSGGLGQDAGAAAAGTAATLVDAAAAAEGQEAASGLRSHPIAFSPDSPAAAAAATAAAAAAAGDERPWGGLIAVGTTIGSGGGEEGEEGEKQQWDDESGGELQGRLLLLQLAAPTAASAGGSRAAAWQEAAPWQEAEAPRRQLQLLPVAELHLPSRVLALCPGTTRLTGAGPGPGPASAAAASGTGTGAGVGSRLFASVGRRLVAFQWRQRQQALRRVTWIPTNRPLCDLKVSRGLLVASDRGEGVTMYRYYEPHPGSPRAAAHLQRSRLARRRRVAPPGAAELQHRLGMQAQHPAQRGPGIGPVAGGQLLPEGEEEELGFAVVAADSECRPAVGAVALPPADGGAAGRGGGAPPPAAAAAAVLDARGRLALLQQRWPRHEPALQQRCVFALGEPAAALLQGSLGYHGGAVGGDSSSSVGGGGSGTSAAAPPAAEAAPGAVGAAAAAAEMVAVTVGGAAVALQPLQQHQAAQLLRLQRALAQHPATSPLSGGSHAAFRVTGSSGVAGGRGEIFRHPPPPGGAGAAGAADSPPASPLTPEQQAGGGGGLGAEPAAAQEPAGPGAMVVDQPGGGAAAPAPAATPQKQQQRGQQVAQAEPPVDAVLDGELLQHYLLLVPEQQRQLVAAAGIDRCGEGGEAAARQLACQLSNLVAQLLL